MPLEDRTRPSSRRYNWLQKLADEKSSDVKNKEKEEGAAREEHRQSATERLGKTVKRRFEYFDHLHFLCLHGKLVVHSKRALNTRISRRERRSRPSRFTVQFVVDAQGP